MKTRTKRTSLNPNLNVGAFGRLDMGIIVEAMRDELLSRGLDGERVLYTDTDVLFANDFDYASLAAIPLPTFAAPVVGAPRRSSPPRRRACSRCAPRRPPRPASPRPWR